MKTKNILTLAGLFCIVLLLAVMPANAQTANGVNITCPNGQAITNGVEVIVNMRPGFTYTATAIGIGGFDPIIAVSDQNGVGLCADDDPKAATYSANLPTTGQVNASVLSSQVPFTHDFNDLADISIIVGDISGGSGEFLLALEGMAVTNNDGSGVGAGDPFTVHVTPNVANSGVPITTYMISLTDDMDPFIQWVDPDRNVLTDDANSPIQCDDAGTNTCWGQSSNLTGSYVSQRQGFNLGGFQYDAMLSLDFAGLDFSGGDDYFANFLMTSTNQRTFGEYFVAFHMSNAGTADGTTVAQVDPVETPDEPSQPQSLTTASGGVNITCPNGQTITNGVEFIVNMRPGFTYTATAIGSSGFDPIIAVSDVNGVGLCADDDPKAATYSANLPTTGTVNTSVLSSQVPFTHNFDDFADISIIVGDLNGGSGEFLLVLEGMAVTEADGSGAGAGDPFTVRLTPNIVNSGVSVSAYMISLTDDLDSLMQWVDSDRNVLTDDAGVTVQCDDAGTNTCWGESADLTGSYVSQRQGFNLGGYGRDAMLSMPAGDFASLDFSEGNEYFLNFLMTSYNQQSFGEYLVAFHVGVAADRDAPGSSAAA